MTNNLGIQTKTAIYHYAREVILKKLVEDVAYISINQTDMMPSRYIVGDRIDELVKNGERTFNLADRRLIKKIVLNEMYGLGPLQPLLNDPTIQEVMVNGPNKIFIERHGYQELTDACFENEEHLRHIIDRIVTPLGRRVDESSPMVDARLPSGDRVNIVIPPLTPTPAITVRKFGKNFSMADFKGNQTLTPEMAEILQICVQARLNVLVVGGTGSGKTSLLNVLGGAIPDGERLITLEDTLELRFHENRPAMNIVQLESRPPNLEGKGEVELQDLLKNTLRMRPDRIVVGEVRDGAAYVLLQAMTTGHPGSMTTLHADGPEEGIVRLMVLVNMAQANLSQYVVQKHIEAIDLIVFQSRMPDGSRRIVSISEFLGFSPTGTPQTNPLFGFETVEELYASIQHDSDEKTIGWFKPKSTVTSGLRTRLLRYLRRTCSASEAESILDRIFSAEPILVGKEHLADKDLQRIQAEG